MALPAERGLKVALKILDKRFGDENTYMNQSREKLIRGPKIRENHHRPLSTMCAQLTSFISFAENLNKLTEIDNQPTIRYIVLRLDDAMQSRWSVYWTGKRGERTQHIKDVLKFLERETKRIENELVLKENYNTETQRLYIGTQETQREGTSAGMKRNHKYPIKPHTREVSLITQSEPPTRFIGSRGVTNRCRLCGENHTLSLCDVFRVLHVDHRRKIVRAQGKCFVCLKESHMAKDCRARPCGVDNCNGRHSRWLHETSPDNQVRREPGALERYKGTGASKVEQNDN